MRRISGSLCYQAAERALSLDRRTTGSPLHRRLCYQAAERALSPRSAPGAPIPAPSLCYQAAERALSRGMRRIASPARRRLCYQAAERALSRRSCDAGLADGPHVSATKRQSARYHSVRIQSGSHTRTVSATKRQSARYHPPQRARRAGVSTSLLPSGRARVITSTHDPPTAAGRTVSATKRQSARYHALAHGSSAAIPAVSATKRQSARCHQRRGTSVRTICAVSATKRQSARCHSPAAEAIPVRPLAPFASAAKINQYAARKPLFNRAHQRALPRRSHLAWRPRAGSSRR